MTTQSSSGASGPCFTSAVLERAVASGLTNQPRLVAHIADCNRCAEAVAAAAVAEKQSPENGRESVGRYLILNELGRGGSGCVYEAYDPELDRKIALKIFDISASSLAVDILPTLVREAQALAHVEHKNVLQVFDAGQVDDAFYIAMQLVRGKTLQAWCEESDRRSSAELGGCFRQVVDGIHAIHSAGIVHRDIKPANILVDDQEGEVRAWVSDLGMARRKWDGPADAMTRLDGDAPTLSLDEFSVTRDVACTPRYAAPEVLRGEPGDERADQYSLALCMYEAFVGELPSGATTQTTLTQLIAVRERRVDVEPLVHSGVRRTLASSIVQALSPEPQDRPSSVLALRPTLSVTRWRWGIAAFLCLAVAVGFVVWASLPRTDGGLSACLGDAEAFGSEWHDKNADIRKHLATSLMLSTQWKTVSARLEDTVRNGKALYKDSCTQRFHGHSISAVAHEGAAYCLANRDELLGTYIDDLLDTPSALLTARQVGDVARLSLVPCRDGSYASRLVPVLSADKRERTQSFFVTYDRVIDLMASGKQIQAKRVRDGFFESQPHPAHLAMVDTLLLEPFSQRRSDLARSVAESNSTELDPYTVALAWLEICNGLLAQSKHEAWRVAMTALEQALERAGNPRWVTLLAKMMRGTAANRRQDFDGAHVLFQEVADEYLEAGERSKAVGALSHLMGVAYNRGDLDEVERLVGEARKDADLWMFQDLEAYGAMLTMATTVAVARGRYEEAVAAARDLLTASTANGVLPRHEYTARCLLADKLATAGAYDLALQEFAKAGQVAEQHDLSEVRRVECDHSFAMIFANRPGANLEGIRLLESVMPRISVHHGGGAVEAAISLAMLLADNRQYARADSLLARALSRGTHEKSDRSMRWARFAYTSFLIRRGRLQDAGRMIEPLVGMTLGLVSSLDALGVAAWALLKAHRGEVDKATVMYNQVKSLRGQLCKHPGSRRVCTHIGHLLQQIPALLE